MSRHGKSYVAVEGVTSKRKLEVERESQQNTQSVRQGLNVVARDRKGPDATRHTSTRETPHAAANFSHVRDRTSRSIPIDRPDRFEHLAVRAVTMRTR